MRRIKTGKVQKNETLSQSYKKVLKNIEFLDGAKPYYIELVYNKQVFWVTNYNSLHKSNPVTMSQFVQSRAVR